MVKLVLMDMAGTTVLDPDGVGQCLKQALTAVGIPWQHEQVNGIMGIPKPVAIKVLSEMAGREPTPDQIHAIHEDFRQRMIDYYRTNPDVREVEGAADVFRKLRESGIKVALDTGFDRPIVDVLLERLGWNDGLLDTTVTSDEVAQGRPHPDLVYLAMKRVGIEDSKDVAKVGDTPSDLGEGTAAGCGWVIGVTSGTHSEEQLLPHPHTHLIDSIRDLPPLFGL